ncbi:hypothetical protein MTO96_017787 [Rhipicephalus appendiculatus]
MSLSDENLCSVRDTCCWCCSSLAHLGDSMPNSSERKRTLRSHSSNDCLRRAASRPITKVRRSEHRDCAGPSHAT